MYYITMVYLMVLLIHNLLLTIASSNIDNSEIIFRLPEENEPKTHVGEIRRSSVILQKFNATVRAKLRYTILNPNAPGVKYFSIDEVSSALSTRQVIDRDTLCSVVQTCCFGTCYIPLIIGIQPRDFFTVLNARVDIVDINDNEPEFPQSTIQIKMSESSPINTTVPLPTAIDIDAFNNKIKKYQILSPTRTFGLRTESSDGEFTEIALINLKPLDRESISYYQVKVLAVDGGLPQKTGTCTVNIELTDANDNKPKFAKSSYSVSIPENTPKNTSILQVHAVDADLGESGKVRYSINLRASDIIKTSFVVEPFSGWIKLMKPLNYEGVKTYKIPIDARDMGVGSLPSRNSVTVHITDINDNAPIVTVNLFTSSGKAEVSEAADVGTLVAHILIQDIDAGLNRVVNCYMDNRYFHLVKMEPSTQEEYKVLTATKMNRENTAEYRVTVICRDSGEPTLETRQSFVVDVLDANDNMPIFSQKLYKTDVFENNPLGMSLLQVHADDQDDGPGGQVRYEVAADGKGRVTINHEGNVYASTIFDRESQDVVTFHIVAFDNGEPALSSTATISIKIKDKNDNAPRFVDVYKFNISENVNAHTMVGRVTAVDNDISLNSVIDYAMGRSGSEYFEISRQGVITTRKRLDREHKSEFSIDIIARDHGKPPLTGKANVLVRVIDINDNSPVFTFPNNSNNTVYISYLEPDGHKITRILAKDKDHGANSQLSFLIKHGNTRGTFEVNQSTGVISVARKLAIQDAYVYKLTVEAKDRGSDPNSNVAILNIVVDGSGKPITISGAFIDKPPNNKNLIIVICLATVSGLLAIVLIIAIICIRKKDVNNHNYNVKTETQRIFNNRRSPNASNGSPASKYSDHVKPLPPKKEVSFSLENDEGCDPNETSYIPGKNETTWGTTKTFETRPVANSSKTDTTQENLSTFEKNSSNYNFSCAKDLWKKKPWKSKPHEPRTKELAGMVKTNPTDTDSESSANHSTADSGRGGSEEDLRLQAKKLCNINKAQANQLRAAVVDKPREYPIYKSLDFADRRQVHTPPGGGHFQPPSRSNPRRASDYSINSPKYAKTFRTENGEISSPQTLSRPPRFGTSSFNPYGSLPHRYNTTHPPAGDLNKNTSNDRHSSRESMIDPDQLCMEIDNLFFKSRDIYV